MQDFLLMWLWSSHVPCWDMLEKQNRSALIMAASLNMVIPLITPALTPALFNKGHRGEGAEINLEWILIITPNYWTLHIRSCIGALDISLAVSLPARPPCPLHPTNSFLPYRNSSLNPWLGSLSLLCAPRDACTYTSNTSHSSPIFGLSVLPTRLSMGRDVALLLFLMLQLPE